MAFGGLKDRHAETIQYLTIFHGPQRKLTHTNLHVTYLGQVAEPYDSKHIDANRFVVTIRAMTDEQIGAALRSLEEVRAVGVPNYYDDQRFGSVAVAPQGGRVAEGEGAFFAFQLLIGEFEAALHMALTAPYAFERSGQKKEKAILRRHWGDWRLCKQMLPRNRIVDYLFANPDDFQGAWSVCRRSYGRCTYPPIKAICGIACWRTGCARTCPHDLTSIAVRLGELPMPRRVAKELRAVVSALDLPLHSARNHLEETDPRKPYFDKILAEEEVNLDQFKLKGFHNLFFSKGDRAAWCFPRDLEARDAKDEENRNKKKLTLRFDLPRGSYATLVVKRITRHWRLFNDPGKMGLWGNHLQVWVGVPPSGGFRPTTA